MDIWNIAEYAAWIISAALALWMLLDMFKVGAQYDESLLLSSREGADELLDQGGLPGGGS
jgi:hypothetical protein